MATSQLDVVVELVNKFSAPAKKIQDDLKKVSDSAKRMGEQVKESFSKGQKSFDEFANASKKVGAGLTAVGVAGGLMLKSLAQTGMTFDSLERGLTAVMGSSSLAQAELIKLREVAKLPGLGLQEAIQGSINLQATGLSAEVARDSLMAFGNALATVGKGKAELDGVVVALSQIQSKGKVSAEEINQIAERVPQIRKVMQDAFGTADTEVLQKMGLSTEEFIGKVTTELQKLPLVAGGFQLSVENMTDSWTLLKLALAEPLTEPLQKLADFLGGLAMKIEEFVKANPKIAEFAAKIALIGTAFALVAGPTLLFIGFIPMLQGGLITLAALFGGLAGAISAVALPITLLTVAIGALYYAWTNNLGGIQEKTASAFQVIQETFDAFMEFVSAFVEFAVIQFTQWYERWKGIIEPMLEWFKFSFQAAFEWVKFIVTSVFNGIVLVVSNAFTLIKGVFDAGTAILQGDWKKGLEILKTTFSSIFDSMTTILNNWIKNALSRIVSFVADAAKKLMSLLGIGDGDSKGGKTSGKRATGGFVGGGQSYMVGERGPEMFTPQRSGYIIPNNKMSGGMTVVVNVGGNVATERDLAESIMDIFTKELQLSSQIT